MIAVHTNILVHAHREESPWLDATSLTVLGELDGYWSVLAELLRSSRVAGPRIHDARIAAICLQHGIGELWSMDRDFSRFPRLITKNPLL